MPRPSFAAASQTSQHVSDCLHHHAALLYGSNVKLCEKRNREETGEKADRFAQSRVTAARSA